MVRKRLLLRLVAHRTDRTVLQVPRALAASCIAASVDVLLIILLVELAGWRPQPAAVTAYLLAGVPQYLLCAFWVFPASPERLSSGFVTYTLLSLVGLGITWAVIAALHDGLQLNYLFAKGVALGLAFCWNFLSRKYCLFRCPRRVTAAAPAQEDRAAAPLLAATAAE